MKNSALKSLCILFLAFAIAAGVALGFVFADRYQKSLDPVTDYKSLYEDSTDAYEDLQEEYDSLKKDYDALTRETKKAIIIVPGILGSMLVDDEYSQPLNFDLADIVALLMKLPTGMEVDQYLYSVINCDENGVPLRSMSPCNMTMKQQYRDGMLQLYKAMRVALTEKFGSTYEVVTWQYDWRQSNVLAAEKLEEFVNEKEYTDIIFVTHSMGGCVVSNFLQKPINRARVELFVPVAAPFLGSYSAVDALCDDTFGVSTGIYYVDSMELNFAPYIPNLASVYELLPNYTTEEGSSTFVIDGKTISTAELYSQFYPSIEGTKKADGTTKVMLSGLQSYQNAMFVNVNGAAVHVSRLVNTHYVVLTGDRTSIGGVYVNGEETKRLYGDGDGTVWWYSATAGLPLDSPNVSTLSDIGHSGINNNYVVKLVSDIIDANYYSHN